MREQTHLCGRIGPNEFADGAKQLVVPFLEVQTTFEFAIVGVVELNGEDDARALGTDDPVRIVQHLSKHGRCRAGAPTDTVVAFGLETVDLSQYRARYDQSHLFECAPWRPVELFERMALYEQVGVYEEVQNGIRHDSPGAFGMQRQGRLAVRAA